MALDKDALKLNILSILDSLSEREENPAQAREDFATALCNAIDAFVKTGDVSVTVNTTGTATAQTGTGTGKIN